MHTNRCEQKPKAKSPATITAASALHHFLPCKLYIAQSAVQSSAFTWFRELSRERGSKTETQTWEDTQYISVDHFACSPSSKLKFHLTIGDISSRSSYWHKQPHKQTDDKYIWKTIMQQTKLGQTQLKDNWATLPGRLSTYLPTHPTRVSCSTPQI